MTSRKAEGVETYKITQAKEQDAFPEPNWPPQSLDELVEASFEGRLIDSVDHPAMRRLLGRRQAS